MLNHITSALSAVIDLCETLQRCQAGSRYLVALAAICAIVYTLHWAQRG